MARGTGLRDLIPWPNWTVERLASTHVHACLTLKWPVPHGEGAKRNPMRGLARVSEYLAETIQADRGYQGVIAHNPIAQIRQFKTRWGRRQPYTLFTLLRAGGDGTLAEILRGRMQLQTQCCGAARPALWARLNLSTSPR